MKKILMSEFDMKDLGPAKKILGIRIDRNQEDGSIFLGQKIYLEKVVEKFSMKDSKLTSQPFTSQFQLTKRQCLATKA